LRGWRSAPWDEETLHLDCGAWSGRVGLTYDAASGYRIRVDGETTMVRLPEDDGYRRRVQIDGVDESIAAIWSGPELHLSHGRFDVVAHERPARSREAEAGGAAVVRAPMPGAILSVGVAPYARVQQGQTLLVLTAMKMELRVQAPIRGIVTAVHVSAGEQVPIRRILVEIQPE
jgi:acetyl/propionyl-CoA carboxylase alpha subunit